MYKITACCLGLTQEEGQAAPNDIVSEFKDRPWHQNPVCTWQESKLILIVENDFDPDGEALLDEFWDAVHAYINWSGPIRFEVSVISLPDEDVPQSS